MTARSVTAEFLGSALLTVVVIGSGIMAAGLTDDVGLQLLINSFATALGLGVLIVIFIALSGAHFNPVITLVDAALTGQWRRVAAYLPAQVAGCIGGAVLANLMFELPTAFSTKDRLTAGTFIAEIVATAGLALVIFALARTDRLAAIPAAVGAYIGAAYFFTSSTSFANPAITVGRMFSDTFAGIAPGSAPGFLLAQALGGVLAYGLVRWLFPVRADAAARQPELSAS